MNSPVVSRTVEVTCEKIPGGPIVGGVCVSAIDPFVIMVGNQPYSCRECCSWRYVEKDGSELNPGWVIQR